MLSIYNNATVNQTLLQGEDEGRSKKGGPGGSSLPITQRAALGHGNGPYPRGICVQAPQRG